jgi:hypothetical protein
MALVYVQEYASLAATPSGDALVSVPSQPPLASYTISNAAGPNQGAKYNPLTKWLMVETDAICSIRFDGTNASATDQRLPANNQPLLVGVGAVPAGNVSVITNT